MLNSQKPEPFFYKPGRFGEHVSVCYKYRKKKNFGMYYTTITAFELFLQYLDNRREMRGKYPADVVGVGVGALVTAVGDCWR